MARAVMDIWIDSRPTGGIVPGVHVFHWKGGRVTNWALPRVNMLCCYGVLVECPQGEAHPKADMHVLPIPDARPYDPTEPWWDAPVKMQAVYFRMHWVGRPGC